MRITQWGEYGIHCASYLARRVEDGAPIAGANEIAAAQGIDVQYAQQILQRLRRGNIIESVRGPHGGYRLARPAAEISVRDILVAVEGDTFEVICETKPLNEERCNPNVTCKLRNLWQDLKNHVDSFLIGKTLEQMMDDPTTTDQHVQINRPSGDFNQITPLTRRLNT